MSITMKEIAEIAGVNISTVSRALSNDRTISANVKNRILEIANQYSYKRRRTIGRIISYVIDKRYFLLTSHFYNRLIGGIEEEVKKNGYIFQFNSLEPNQFAIDNINIKNIAGMIVTSNYHDDFILEMEKIGIPLVLVDYYLPTENIIAILTDKIDGIITGIKYLTSLGHKRIAYLKGDTSSIGVMDRITGFKRAVTMFNLDSDEDLLIDCDFSIKGAYEDMKKYLDSHKELPSAVMCTNDMIAIGAMDAIKEKRLKIPDDINVLGFDDIDLASEVNPRLSTLHVRKRTMGRLAVQNLFKIIHGERIEFNKIIIKPTLIVRESTCKIKS